jgi:hypothetical protein
MGELGAKTPWAYLIETSVLVLDLDLDLETTFARRQREANRIRTVSSNF